MKKANIYEFRTHFAKYAQCVREGASITLCDHNEPFAEVRPIRSPPSPPKTRPLGLYEGRIAMAPDFDGHAVNRKIAKLFSGAIKA